jgi:hypothetical protein
MAKCYFERRKQSAKGTDSLIADMMRHLHTREYLGKAIIICDQPVVTLSAARKQWLKLARVIQKQRASTLNADKILKYTHAIAHMQHLHFSAKDPLEDPDGDIYFLSPEQLHLLPLRCFSVYVAHPIDLNIATGILAQLPDSALIVDYDHGHWEKLGLQTKHILEQKVVEEWQEVTAFLALNDINIVKLSTGSIQDIEAMDDALDTLLGISHPFLQVANSFQHALETARPLRLSQETRRGYDAFSLLAHRVQALSLESFTQRFLETYNEDDTFFLYDFVKGLPLRASEGLTEIINYHLRAGRVNLAKALQTLYMGRSFRPNTKPI